MNTTSNRIHNSMLTPNTQLLIRGKVDYCRITSHIEGDELEKDKERKSKMGVTPIDKPYTSITIENPVVQLMNDQQPTIDEQYLMGKIYETKSEPKIKKYTANSKSPYLPSVSVVRPDNPTVADQIKPKGELDKGLDVTLVLRVFESHNNKGLALDLIMVNEPIRYFTSGSKYAKQLQTRGITINPLQHDQVQTEPQQPIETMPIEEASGDFPTQNYQQITTAPNGSAAFTANAAAPAVQTPEPAPAQFAMNPPTGVNNLNTSWTCACGQINDHTQNFCGGCGSPKPQPTANAQTDGTAPATTNPDSPWVCSCGMHNAATQKFCGSCGTPRPVNTNNEITASAQSGIVYSPQ